MISAPVHIIGASGRSGVGLMRALRALGHAVVPIVRDPAKIDDPTARLADLTQPDTMARALRDATRVVCCAHARHAAAVIAAAPPSARLVFLGSTRKFTRWPDAHGNGVLAGEAAFLASGRDGAMLHPTMIYGARGENNVQRLADLLRRLPIAPLPNGGTALVQPIHQDDVTAAILAALSCDWAEPRSLTIAGPTPVAYADFIRAIARAAGLRPPRILAFPALPMVLAAGLTRFVPGLPTVHPSEIRRLLEDKAFDIAPMRAELGIDPIGLDEGLARTFAPQHDP